MFSLQIFNKSKICGIRSSKRFDWKMSVQVHATFSNLKFSFQIVLHTSILDLLMMSNFISWFLFILRLEFKFKEQSFRVYRDRIYFRFPLKVCFCACFFISHLAGDTLFVENHRRQSIWFKGKLVPGFCLRAF